MLSHSYERKCFYMKINIEENIRRFKELVSKISDRDGFTELLDYVVTKTDYYHAPASTRFHLSCEGGLLQHSLNVCDCLLAKKNALIWKDKLVDIPEETLIFVALFHDLCKVNTYMASTRNQKTYDHEKVKAAKKGQIKNDSMGDFIWETVPSYEFKDSMPLGHGEKSALIIQQFMKLKAVEVFAIRWHMGFSEVKDNWGYMTAAMEKYPLVLALHEADLEASYLMEVE